MAREGLVAHVRAVTPADVNALGLVHAACWRQTYSHILSPTALSHISAERMASMWTSKLEQDAAGDQVLAEVGGEVVGFAGKGPIRDGDLPRGAELYFIYLLAEQHGSGLGQSLLDAIEPVAVVWVAADNPRAQSFYRRNGFVADGSEKTEEFFGEPIKEIRMVRA